MGKSNISHFLRLLLLADRLPVKGLYSFVASIGLIVLLSGCGKSNDLLAKNSTAQEDLRYPLSSGSGGSIDDGSQTPSRNQGNLITCGITFVGCSVRLSYQNQVYVVSSHSKDSVWNLIQDYNNGHTYSVSFVGQFTREKGNFPNPTVEMDSVILSELKIL